MVNRSSWTQSSSAKPRPTTSASTMAPTPKNPTPTMLVAASIASSAKPMRTQIHQAIILVIWSAEEYHDRNIVAKKLADSLRRVMHRRSRILFVLILASATPLFAFDGLTFHSVPPCVAFDTRPAFGGTGAIAAEEARVFYIVGTTAPFTAQGGTAGGCGVPPFFGGEPVARAIFINYVAIDPAGAGSVKAWATDQAEPV